MRKLLGHGELLLYLDYDGVLHHENVWWHARIGPYMRAPDEYRLFQHLPLLESVLAPYPQVKIILSTSWARRYSCAKAAKNLGPNLRARVLTATFDRRMNHDAFDALHRGQQVWNDVQKRQPKGWLALDDEADGWPPESEGHFIQTDKTDGISHPEVLQKIKAALEQLCNQ